MLLIKYFQNEKNNANTLQKNNQFYKVSELETAFGKTVAIIAKNLSEFDPSTKDPFPLSRAITSDANQSLHTVSVHRLFARGHSIRSCCNSIGFATYHKHNRK